ncbi:hypothetical protein NUSPORA_02641 [Nucleospora cyclopteri]
MSNEKEFDELVRKYHANFEEKFHKNIDQKPFSCLVSLTKRTIDTQEEIMNLTAALKSRIYKKQK